MSHFSNIKTKIRNLNSLKAALNDLEVDWKNGPGIVRGYQGQTHQADVVVEQNNNYDFGFSWNGSEYETRGRLAVLAAASNRGWFFTPGYSTLCLSYCS